MGLKIKKILGINITTTPKSQVLEEIRKHLEKTKKQSQQGGTKIENEEAKVFVIFTPNPEIIVYAQRDENFKRIINSAQINVPDGVGVCWSLKKLYGLAVERLTGADLMEELIRLAYKNRFTIGLIGGQHGVAVQALECLKRKCPGLSGWALEGPEIKIQNSKFKIQNYKSKLEMSKDTLEMVEWNPRRWKDLDIITTKEIKKIVNKIVKEKTDILFVAFGFPKQEYFIEEVKNQISGQNMEELDKPLVAMAVGGSFDYIAGRVPRAPKWVRDRGLEWLHRLIREPWRLSRQLTAAQFFLQVIANPLRERLLLGAPVK